MKNMVIILLLAITLYSLFTTQKRGRVTNERIVIRDTIVRDTIRDTMIIESSREVIRIDTIIINDTISITIPINRYEFSDSSYKFIVEGYRVRPISMEIYPTTHYRSVERIKESILPTGRLSFGVVTGVGIIYGTKGIDCGIICGVGINYRLISRP